MGQQPKLKNEMLLSSDGELLELVEAEPIEGEEPIEKPKRELEPDIRGILMRIAFVVVCIALLFLMSWIGESLGIADSERGRMPSQTIQILKSFFETFLSVLPICTGVAIVPMIVGFILKGWK